MSCVFYVLPPREFLGRQFAGFLSGLFPGLDWTATAPANLSDMLTALAECQGEVYVVHRDELTENDDLELSLVQDFGAEKGDLIVEAGNSLDTPPAPARVWRVTCETAGPRAALFGHTRFVHSLDMCA